MKKRSLYGNGTVLLMSLLLLVGCGSADISSDTMAMGTKSKMNYEAAAADVEAAEFGVMTQEVMAEELTEAESEQIEVQDESRKLIRNVEMTAETEEFDELLKNVQSRIVSFGGYVESSYIYNHGSYYNGTDFDDLRNADLTVRIPAEKLDEFLSVVSEQTNVISQNESVTDVTLEYVDLESHKKALLAEQERLLELMEQAQSIDDIISLESRLSEVRYQLESMESQLRTYDNQVSYSTVYLYIEEVKTYTPTQAPGRLERMKDGFFESLSGVGNGFLDFCINFVIALPYLVVFAAVTVAVVWLVRIILKRHRKKKKGIDEHGTV